MNPHDLIFSKGRYKICRHLAFWIAWLIFASVVQLTNFNPGSINAGDIIIYQIIRSITRMPSILIFCYVTIYLFIPKFLIQKKYFQFVLYYFIFLCLLYLFNYYIQSQTYGIPKYIASRIQMSPVTPFLRKFFSFYSNINFTGASGKICGTVTRSDGVTPIADALVFATDSTENAVASDLTDSSGHYQLKALPTGTYTVWSSSGPNNEHTAARASGVSVTNGQTTTCNLAGGSISGTIRDSSQMGIDGVAVVAISEMNIFLTTTDASGSYMIQDLPASEYTLVIHPNGRNYVAAKVDGITVAGTQTTNQNVTLVGPDGAIEGTVTDTAQAPIAGALVIAIDHANPNSASVAATTAINGDYTIRHLDTGTYTLYAWADGYVSDCETDVPITAGQTTLGKDFTLNASSSPPPPPPPPPSCQCSDPMMGSISNGGTQYGSLGAGGFHYYLIEVDCAGILTISLDHNPAADFDWYLVVAGTEEEVMFANSSSSPDENSSSVSAGCYCLRVYQYSGAGSYNVTASWECN